MSDEQFRILCAAIVSVTVFPAILVFAYKLWKEDKR